MYKFDFHEDFPCAPKEIFERSMYKFDEYEKFSPDVKKVDVLSRESHPDGREKIVLHVFAKVNLPAAVRAIMNMHEIDWNETYVADPEKLTADWSVESPIFTKYVDCEGTSSCVQRHGGARVSVTGSMNIAPMPIVGIPPSLVRAGIKTLEPFIGNMITYNLKKYFKSVRSTIEKESRA